MTFPCAPPTCANLASNAKTRKTEPTASALMEVPAVSLPRTTAPATTAIARGKSLLPCPPSHQLRQKTAGGGVQAGGMWDVTGGGTGGRWPASLGKRKGGTADEGHLWRGPSEHREGGRRRLEGRAGKRMTTRAACLCYLNSYWASLRGHFPTQNKPGVLSQDSNPSKGNWIRQPRPQAAR